MTDDQTVESMRVMSQVQSRVAARGTTLLNSFATFPLCCPSRATFLTGQYAHNHGVLGNFAPEGGYDKLDHSNTLAVWLRDAGYRTVHIGKYLNGYEVKDPSEIPPGWTEWYTDLQPKRYYDYWLNENGTPVYYGSDDASYKTDVFTRRAVEVVRRLAPGGPFFLWLSHHAPHAGEPVEPGDPSDLETPVPARRHQHSFDSEPLPRPPSFNEADVSDKPAAIRKLRRLRARKVASIQENYRQRLETLLAVDEGVAELVIALGQTGELANTMVIFTSDNGYFHGEHRIPHSKDWVYEPAARVPLVVRGPGVPAGLQLSQFVGNVDLAPTIVDLAGATAGLTMDGRSLLPLFRDPGRDWDRTLLLQSWDPREFEAVRTAQYVYAEHPRTGEIELYDLQADPDELVSRHDDPTYEAVKLELAERLLQLRRCAGSGCW